EVLLDDRDERPGVMFADMELIGIPDRLVIGERGLAGGVVEHRSRATGAEQEIEIASLTETLRAMREG
ncbi:MAG: His/Gly/Thr/Pro-type tRNA ligase C-terminal domain-containing protein, partial [bacterium]